MGTVLKRLAVGTALALAMPIKVRGAGNLPNASKVVNPVVRYAHFEKSYQTGELDPAFPVLTAFELVHTMDADAQEEDFDWLRASLAAFRPDLAVGGYHWRYAETVHSEVQYGDSQCGHFPGVCKGHCKCLLRDARKDPGTVALCHCLCLAPQTPPRPRAPSTAAHCSAHSFVLPRGCPHPLVDSDIPVGGDVCGGRAFWSRFTRKGYGIPTWGATEHAHAAMSSWTPTGWNVMLGAPWPDC